jgi:hypothetical protein
MNLKTDKPIFLVLVELFFKHLFWYLVFSVVYFNINPEEWWVVQNVWGRIILLLIEMGILSSTFTNINEK